MFIVPGEAAPYWAYLPDPLVVQPVTWNDPTPRVFTNLADLLGGLADNGVGSTFSKTFSWEATSSMPPICFQFFTNDFPQYGCVYTNWFYRYLSTYAGTDGYRPPVTDVHPWGLLEVFPSPSSSINSSAIGMRPPGRLPCAEIIVRKAEGPLWTECYLPRPLVISPTGIDFPITDWSKNDTRSSYHYQYIPGSILTTQQEMFHPDLWKVVAAMGPINNSRAISESGSLTFRTCVPKPFLLVIGRGQVVKDYGLYHISCINCKLSNCVPVDTYNPNVPIHVFLVMQPPFFLLPVEVEGPWYANYGYQFALELENALSRKRRFIGMLIAGIGALITLIASATVSSFALAQTIHTADHVNALSQNISLALHIQQDVDQKLLARLDGIEEAVEYLGTQLSALKAQMSFMCHGAYQHICVTPLSANNISWEKVHNHLRGIWHDTNVSLDLLQLQREITTIGHARLDISDPAKMAGRILTTLKDALQGFNPGNILHYTFWILFEQFLGESIGFSLHGKVS
ncbi:endogenous retrovirus group K member 13-1 Env polyprotein-like [Mustela erminea]|uniref:endogenous retrovirus group K member 13-1 Env polyprotein-like n=1 Tax=Mustela erminea TaxID=36723 RepID=UPI001386986F|nr:endogenous retrovirus group K member 13-1 Env polyprotein-like [Mustela erminea]